MKIDVEKIKINLEKRIRTTSGLDVKFLKESLNEHDLIQPIIIDEDFNLIAGYRRLMAAIELGWKRIEVVVKKGLTELQKLDIEIQENLRRVDLTDYELDIALARRKEIYEELHPLTKWGGSKPKKPKKKNQVEVTSTSKKDNAAIKNGAKKKTFSKVYSKGLDLGERTVRKKARVGRAILNGKINPDIVEQFKKGETTETEILKLLKRAEDEGEKKESLFSCKDCNKGGAAPCPYCGKQVIACDKGYKLLRKPSSRACDKFEE